MGRDFVRISHRHIFKRVFMTAIRYQDGLLDLTVSWDAAAVGPAFCLMDDNSLSHRAVLVEVYLDRECQEYSLDLNPMENLSHSDKQLDRRNFNYVTLRWLIISRKACLRSINFVCM